MKSKMINVELKVEELDFIIKVLSKLGNETGSFPLFVKLNEILVRENGADTRKEVSTNTSTEISTNTITEDDDLNCPSPS